MVYSGFYEAPAENGLLTNYEDTIPGPSYSIGAPKMYIKKKNAFFTTVPKNGPKKGLKFKKRQKITKS